MNAAPAPVNETVDASLAVGSGGVRADRDLVLDVKAGSAAAFDTLVRRYQRPLYFVCYRYVHDHDAAADLAQRAFVRVMEKVADLRDAELFRSWLFTIGTNLALNHLRDSARLVDEAHGEAVVAPEAHAWVEKREQLAALRDAVTRLPPRQRAVLQLRVYEDMPFGAIARVLATTENAAKVNFHLAVKRLRSLLQTTS